MKLLSVSRWVMAGAFASAMASALTGCASSAVPVPPCCYQGAVVTDRLANLTVTLEDGRQVPFASAFPGFAPSSSVLTRDLPLSEIRQDEQIYANLIPLLPLYDANGDGRLERPEVLVLYAREAALATGVRVAHFGPPPGTWALATANHDIDGLVRWVEQRRQSMTPQGQAVFRDLVRLGQDQITRGSDGNSGDHLFYFN